MSRSGNYFLSIVDVNSNLTRRYYDIEVLPISLSHQLDNLDKKIGKEKKKETKRKLIRKRSLLRISV